MANLVIYSSVYNGQISNLARDIIKQTLQGLEGREVEIVIKDKKRSIKQNAYRWSVVVGTVMKSLNEWLERGGHPLASPEDIDIFIKDKALGVVHKVNTPIGEIVIAGKLKDKNTQEFEDSMECIRAHFAEKGIIIPLPREKL